MRKTAILLRRNARGEGEEEEEEGET